MNWFTRLAQREYRLAQQVAALLLGQVLFLLAFPCLIVVGASYVDRWFHLPRFVHGLANPVAALLLMVPGGLLVEWTVQAQFSLGEGTPIPIVATRRLITQGPYRYTRNPMATGTTMFYLGLAVWVGSVPAVALALIYPTIIAVYTRLVEEKELEERFGSEYLEYKRGTPFVIPRLPKRD